MKSRPLEKKGDFFVIFFTLIISALPELIIFYIFNDSYDFSMNFGIAFGFLKNIPDFVLPMTETSLHKG